MAEMKGDGVWVGIDWGSEWHQVCVIDSSCEVLLEKCVAHDGAALLELADELVKLVDGDAKRLAIGIERPHGAVVETMLERGISVFSINPKQLDRFRDRHTVAGAKDDRRDAFVLADSLRTDAKSFRAVRLGEAELVMLRELSRTYDELKGERQALGNRLYAQLQRYFPQVMELGSVYDSRWLWLLLERYPTPAKARRVPLSTLRSLLERFKIRRIDAEGAREILRREPLHVAPGVVEASSRHVLQLLERLRLVEKQQDSVAEEIEALLTKLTEPDEGKVEHRDAAIILSLPGVGPLTCAAMLSEAWEPLSRGDYQTLRKLSGAAPVTKRSGKQLTVSRRLARNERLANALFLWSRAAVQWDEPSRAHYRRLRATGCTHGRALRGLGDRLLAVATSMLRSRTLYDSSRRRASLTNDSVRGAA